MHGHKVVYYTNAHNAMHKVEMHARLMHRIKR